MTHQPSSPSCRSAEPDEVSTKYAGRDEIVAALNELLEAERAGARVALASSKATEVAGYVNLMRQIRADEAHWCAILRRQIRRFGGSPSRKTGAFHAKAIAISEPMARLAFLNRGQAWVVRRLEELMPRVRDDLLYAELLEMTDRHRANFEMAEIFRQEGAPR